MTCGQAVAIGGSQVLALGAGISRLGVAVVGGLTVGPSAKIDPRFSFRMATSLILAAGMLEPHHRAGGAHGLAAQAAAGLVVAGVVADCSVCFRTPSLDSARLLPPAAISAAAGIVFAALLVSGL